MYIIGWGLAEQRGIGLRSMESLSDEGFPLPVRNLIGNVLEIAFARTSDALPQIITDDVANLSNQDKLGIQYIQANEPITAGDYAEQFSITNKTAQRRLSDLVDKNLLIKVGERRWTKYRIQK